jgi:hypothetical protein
MVIRNGGVNMIKNSEQIKRIKDGVNATLAFEGLKPSKVANDANDKMLRGEITGDEARRRILANYNLVAK